MNFSETDFTWYSASPNNTVIFDEAFIAFIVSTFGVSADQVTILNVSSGSIIVNLQMVITSDSAATTLSSQVSSFISSPSATALQSLGNNLPRAAFQDPSKGVTLDQTGSSSGVSTSSNHGLIRLVSSKNKSGIVNIRCHVFFISFLSLCQCVTV